MTAQPSSSPRKKRGTEFCDQAEYPAPSTAIVNEGLFAGAYDMEESLSTTTRLMLRIAGTFEMLPQRCGKLWLAQPAVIL